MLGRFERGKLYKLASKSFQKQTKNGCVVDECDSKEVCL